MEIYEQSKPPIAKWVAFGVLLILFILNMILVLTNSASNIDKSLLEGFMAMRNDFLNSAVKAITFCGNTTTIIGVCFVLLLLPTRFRFGAPASVGVAIAAAVNSIIKLLVGRPRPDAVFHLIGVSSSSFPSGHANAGFIFYIMLMVLLRRYFFLRGRPAISWFFTLSLTLLAFGIGLSRIYLGVHYPTDVFAGWLLGGMMLILVMTGYEAYYPQRWVITYNLPAWQGLRRRRPWRRPSKPNRPIPLVEFPTKSEWNEPRISSAQQGDSDANMLLQKNQAPEAARERRRAQIRRMEEERKRKDRGKKS